MEKKGILRALIVVVVLGIIISIATKVDEEQEVTKQDTKNVLDVQNSIDNTLKNIGSITDKQMKSEYTGTIPPYTYTTDIVQIDKKNNSVYGITSNKDTYSGLMRYDLSDTDINIENIELYKTYDIECKPLIRDTINNEHVTPYVIVMNISESTQESIDELNSTKEELSRYIEFKVTHETKELEDIIQAANIEYYKWSNSDILDYQNWIQSIGYSDNNENITKSLVKTIEQLKEEQ